MEKNIQFSLEFHYEFYDDSIHVMDARSFNFCELQLLKAIEYNRENDLYKFSKRNVHFSPFFRGSSSSLEYHLKGF